MEKVIAEMKPHGTVILHGIFHADARGNEITYYPFDEEMSKSIEESVVVVAADASVKESQMGGSWIITDIEQKRLLQNHLCLKK